jgi:hypothetical protein
MNPGKNIDALALLANVNPVAPSEVAALATSPEFDRTYALIRNRRGEGMRARRDFRASTWRRYALASAMLVALAVPALALSDQLGNLFGFSTEGTPADATKVDLHFASQLAGVGADTNVRLLDTRDGVSFYVARGTKGTLCLATASANAAAPTGLSASFGCMSPAAAAKFPSPEEPVWSMTAYMSPVGGPTAGVFVTRLAGFAADGVASVEVVAKDGRMIAKTNVDKNVFLATDIPQVPIRALVARDAAGKIVWQESLER